MGKQFLGLHPIFPEVLGSHAFTVKHEKQTERKNGGGERRVDEKKRRTCTTATTQVFKITLVKSINPDPNVYPSSLQHSPSSVVRPDLSLRARPSPRDREEGKAGLATLLASRLPPPARSPARRRLTAPAR